MQDVIEPKISRARSYVVDTFPDPWAGKTLPSMGFYTSPASDAWAKYRPASAFSNVPASSDVGASVDPDIRKADTTSLATFGGKAKAEPISELYSKPISEPSGIPSGASRFAEARAAWHDRKHDGCKADTTSYSKPSPEPSPSPTPSPTPSPAPARLLSSVPDDVDDSNLAGSSSSYGTAPDTSGLFVGTSTSGVNPDVSALCGGQSCKAEETQQPQQSQQAPSGGDDNLTAATLAAAPAAAQKQMLGVKLFPVIAKMHPQLAGKITGMMLELGNSELLILLESPHKLKEKVDEALRVLHQ